ncbi:MAG: hypothetical protein SWK76_07650 [Actinomycetota bacterium]|nr:hypothetical protein [Actinomycetota bacterium]
MGRDFFQLFLEMVRKHAPAGMRISYTIRTNAILLDNAWCEFLHENGFLVRLSMDGPHELHDVYRRDRSGRSTFERVERAALLLQHHGVDFNILCAVNAANANLPLDVYRYLRDTYETNWGLSGYSSYP